MAKLTSGGNEMTQEVVAKRVQDLRLEDFADLQIVGHVPRDLFFVHKFRCGTLERVDIIQPGTLYTEKGASVVATNISEENASFLAVVFSHRGKPLEVYYRGERVAIS